MGNFDVTTPAGSDLLSIGDDKIREFKVAMREALRAGEVAGDDIEGVEAIFPGSAPSTDPVYRYRGLAGITGDRPSAGQYGLFFDTTRKVLQRDNGTSWEDVGQMVLDGSVTEAKLSASVAGDGLAGGANTPLSVNVGTGLEISSDAVRIAASAAGNGLSGGAGSALAVNVDDSTIEINADILRVKDGGITTAKLETSLQNLFVNTRVKASTAINNDGAGIYYTVVDHTGLGRLLGVAGVITSGGGSHIIRITIDGVTYTSTSVNVDRYLRQSNGTTFGFTSVSSVALMDAMNILFSTSLKVEIASTGSINGQTTCYVVYEKNA